MYPSQCRTASIPQQHLPHAPLCAAGWVQQPVLPFLPELACTLYGCIELEPHWGFEQDGSNEARLVQLLMPALPALAVALRLPADRRPPGCSWETAAVLLKTVNLPVIEMVVEHWYGAADSRSLVGALPGPAQLLAMLDWPAQARGMSASQAQFALFGPCVGAVCLLISYAGRSGTPTLASSLQDATNWCTAASSALRALPLLARFQQPPLLLMHKIVELASWASLAAADVAGRRVAGDDAALTATAEDAATLSQAVWELHTSAARLVHTIAPGTCGKALAPPNRVDLTCRLSTLSSCMSAASLLFGRRAALRNPEGGHTNRWVESSNLSEQPAAREPH